MNEIRLSGKVFRLNKRMNFTTFSLMFEFNKDTKMGAFINVSAVKNAHQQMEEINEKEYVIAKGSLKQVEYEKEGRTMRGLKLLAFEIEKKEWKPSEKPKENKQEPMFNNEEQKEDNIPF